jgi:hypothetical protein
MPRISPASVERSCFVRNLCESSALHILQFYLSVAFKNKREKSFICERKSVNISLKLYLQVELH